jgi:hypothetical protein
MSGDRSLRNWTCGQQDSLRRGFGKGSTELCFFRSRQNRFTAAADGIRSQIWRQKESRIIHWLDNSCVWQFGGGLLKMTTSPLSVWPVRAV